MKNDFKPGASRIAQEAIMAGIIAKQTRHCECGGALKIWHDGAPVGQRKPVRLCTVCGTPQSAPDLEAMVAQAEVAQVGGLI